MAAAKRMKKSRCSRRLHLLRRVLARGTFARLCFAVLLLLYSLAAVAVVSALTPSTSPEEIIYSQLAALRQDNMADVYRYASPANKMQTGTLETFGRMVRSPPYNFLVRHEEADILLESQLGASRQYLVRIVPNAKSFPRKTTTVEYWWSLSPCTVPGEYQGCYMVDAVIPNA
jgi:hypothetical protein